MKKMQAISIYFDACSWRISATQIGKVKQFASACLSLSPACFIVIGSKATSDSQIRLSYQRIVAIKHQLIAFGLRPKHIILAAECADSNILQHGLANTQDDEAVTPTIQSAADVGQNSGYSVVIVKPLFG